LTVFWLSIGFGVITASVLSLAAVGLALQYGVTNYPNFAYGEFLTLGAYYALLFNSVLHLNIWVSMLGGALLMGATAVVLNVILLRPAEKMGLSRPYLLIVTFGLSLILVNTVLATWGPETQVYVMPFQEAFAIGPVLVTVNQLAIMGLAVTAMIAIHILLTRTKLGKAMRAMSNNRVLALACGINTDRMTTVAWFFSGAMAGLAGVALAIDTSSFSPTFGGQFLFVIFAAMILGGLGSPYGAMLGAVVIGLTIEVSAVFINSALKDDVAFAILVLILLVRPQGLFNLAGRIS
jgi:branched-chain amino acid transport system permease protein/neutral amino acid transport system permease protein